MGFKSILLAIPFDKQFKGVVSLLNDFDLVVSDKHYIRSDIKYNKESGLIF